MVDQIPFIPPNGTTTTSTSSTTSTTACTSTITSNPITISAYKGIGKGIPAFTYQSTKAGVKASGFRIKSLPLVGDGILYLNNVAVTDEQLLNINDNGKLIYVPVANADAQATFTFLTETPCGNSVEETVTINVTDPPADDDCNCNSTTTSSTSTTTL